MRVSKRARPFGAWILCVGLAASSPGCDKGGEGGGEAKDGGQAAADGAKAAAANEFTVEQHLATLVTLRDEARAEGQFAPAIKAEELRGKCAGFYTDRLVHLGPDGGPVQAITRIELVARRG